MPVEVAQSHREDLGARAYAPRRHVTPSPLVLGMGNTLLGDDGVGIKIVSRLRDQPAFASAHFVDGGTMSFSLLGLVENAAAMLVIDAAELGESPGTVRIFKDDAMDRFLASSRRRSVHEVGLCDLQDMARLLGCLPDHRTLLCVQPGTIAWGEALSPPVAASFEAAVAQGAAVLRDWIEP